MVVLVDTVPLSTLYHGMANWLKMIPLGILLWGEIWEKQMQILKHLQETVSLRNPYQSICPLPLEQWNLEVVQQVLLLASFVWHRSPPGAALLLGQNAHPQQEAPQGKGGCYRDGLGAQLTGHPGRPAPGLCMVRACNGR